MIDSEKIKAKSRELGFSDCGIAEAQPLDLAGKLEKWLGGSFHGNMEYMERNPEKRLDPSKLFAGARSVIVLAAPYYTQKYKPQGNLKISRYASGRDYHRVLKKMGQKLIDWFGEEYGKNNSRVFVDTAPLLEKEWARMAGLGWLGKNTCLILPGKGSWFFLALILTDLELRADKPETREFCGNCTKCIDACPTNAISREGYIDSRKCISYLTIESRNQIPGSFAGKTDNWLFGCDICQEVCPHNRFAIETNIVDFLPRPSSIKIESREVLALNEDDFKKKFAGSPLKRAGLNKLKMTVSFLLPDV